MLNAKGYYPIIRLLQRQPVFWKHLLASRHYNHNLILLRPTRDSTQLFVWAPGSYYIFSQSLLHAIEPCS